jgi:hypothetical protein
MKETVRWKVSRKIVNSSVDGSDHLVNFGQRHTVREMVHLMGSRNCHRWSKEMGPAIFILLLTITLSIFLGEFTFLKGREAIYMGLLRFFHLTLVLCLPLLALLPIESKLGWVIRRKGGVLLQMEEKQDLGIHPMKHWLIRPFQGIGIGLLFATKLLGILQIVTGSTAKVSLFVPQGQFQPGRFFTAAGVAVFVSLLLSTLWTLDDMGVRYFNRKNHEIKMIGKYMGRVMPVLFGFYGMLSLIGEYPKTEALIYLFQIIVILYPPFAVFSVIHSRYIQGRGENLLKRLSIEKQGFSK